MRAVLMIVVLLPLMGVIAFYGSRGYLRATRRARHIEELEAENRRYDEFLHREGESVSQRRRGEV